jgi:hypothetical protein
MTVTEHRHGRLKSDAVLLGVARRLRRVPVEVDPHAASGRGARRQAKPAVSRRPGPVSNVTSDDMKDEYDFSKAERGRFYRKDAVLAPPVHLDPKVLAFLSARAEGRGISLDELVNELLKKDIELIEAAE